MVYVDNWFETGAGDFKVGPRTLKMSHCIADTKEELLAMMRKIGVDTRWIQYEGTLGEHFDIAKGKRELAIKAGAKAIHWHELNEIMKARSDRNGVDQIRNKFTKCDPWYNKI